MMHDDVNPSLATSPRQGEQCWSDAALDAVIAGVRSEDSHVPACPRCATRLRLFRAAAQTSSQAVQRLIAQASRSVPAPRTRRSWFGLPAPLLWGGSATCAAMALLVVLFFPRSHDPGVRSEQRMKGSAVRCFLMRAGQVSVAGSDQLFRTGDALRFAVTSDRPGFSLLVGIEASGKVSAYHPFGGTESVALEAGVDVPLGNSLVLDDSRETEYFLTLLSAEPVTLRSVEDEIASLRRAPRQSQRLSLEELELLALPGTAHWTVVRKVAP